MRTLHRANRKTLHVGDLVIHDRDAKEHRMIRVVVALLPGGLIRTVYKFRQELPETWRGLVFRNRPEELMDPNRFGVSTRRM